MSGYIPKPGDRVRATDYPDAIFTVHSVFLSPDREHFFGHDDDGMPMFGWLNRPNPWEKVPAPIAWPELCFNIHIDVDTNHGYFGQYATNIDHARAAAEREGPLAGIIWLHPDGTVTVEGP